MNEVRVRRLDREDIEFLRAMFLETVCWREDGPRLSLEEVLATPDLAKYVVGWGRPGDVGVVAVSDSGEPLGVAWSRLFDANDHGYGYLSPDIPELGIGIKAGYRGRGLGRRLMAKLVRLAIEQGRPGLSLSVEEDNSRASHLYESLGFERVERVQNAWTMLLILNPSWAPPSRTAE